MKKIPALARAALASLVLAAGCAAGRGAGSGLPEAEIPTVEEILERRMPQQMADGIVKVAIVRNLAVGDHTWQFLEGCVSEGRDLGFTVDTFVTGGDSAWCRELITRIQEADYDGLILSHGGTDFTYDALKPVVEKGLKVVTFDSLPFENGDPDNPVLPGVTSTAQEDAKLAEISLEAILAAVGPAQRGARPVRVIRAWFGGIPPLDRRQAVYDRFVREGLIEEAAWIQPRDFAYSHTGAGEALTAILPKFPEGTVDAVWAPNSEFAKGCIDALDDAGRRDIKLVSVDLSNDIIALMLKHPGVWVSAAAVDPKLIGVVNMRLLAAKFAGEPTPETYTFDAWLVETSRLNRSINMASIARVVPGWEKEQDIFGGYPWMAELKTAREKRLRLYTGTNRDRR